MGAWQEPMQPKHKRDENGERRKREKHKDMQLVEQGTEGLKDCAERHSPCPTRRAPARKKQGARETAKTNHNNNNNNNHNSNNNNDGNNPTRMPKQPLCNGRRWSKGSKTRLEGRGRGCEKTKLLLTSMGSTS